jgi:LysR family glycine cleavage system transcriptional activator
MDKRLRLLNNLHCFEAAARHQSYSRAADELYISQAAVSQQMRNLEESLSVQLFVRSGRSMLLTDAGELLFQACQKGFNNIVQGLDQVQNEELSGELTITSTQAFCALWLMPKLYDFAQQQPDISVRVLGSNQVEDLQKRRIDVAIRFSASADKHYDESLDVEHVGKHAVVPVCSPMLVDKAHISEPADFLKCHLISLACDEVICWENWFKHVKVEGYKEHTKKIEVTSSDLALSAVLSGHGAMLASENMIQPYITSGQLLIPFAIELPVQWNTYLVHQINSPKLAKIKLFCDWFKDQWLA